jgi:hypothetical protein
MLERTRALLVPLVCLASACGGMQSGGAAKRAVSPSETAYPGTPVASEDYGEGGDAIAGSPQTPPAQAEARAPDERPGLGTVWGESVWAPVTHEAFERSTRDPWAVAVIHYNDADGVQAHANYLGASLNPIEIFPGDGSLGVGLVDESGALLPGFSSGGRTLVVGEDGARYRLVIRNGTSARFEVVASVDGLDVIDGKPADPNRRGYILEAYGVLVIDGFRQSSDQVAAFRFGAVGESYAARTSGDRNVGVIGVAIFAEKGAVWTPAELQRRDTADPFPARGYATPP